MAQTKFFHQLSTPIKTFFGMRAPRRANEKQEIPITFRIALNGNNIRSAPKFVQSAYQEIQNGADFVGLKKELDNVNVEIYNLPENKKPSFRLPRLHLQNLAVKETKNSEGDTSTMLCFETLYPWDSAVWEYLGERYSTDVFTRFDSAQATLLDLQEAEDETENDKQEELPIEDMEEEETEEADAS
jgi:hypothetical protein